MSEAAALKSAVDSYTTISSNGTRVRMIPATMQRFAAHRSLAATLRVAAYARVSTDEEEQQTSYEAQVDYYTKKIRENPEWIFVEVYADEGITGTSTKRRKNFNRMIEDAMAGKIDRIITKSVSRFARNTVDTLTTIRMLKEKGVGVTFEKEAIDTLDSKGELLITIMSSLAQEESRSISENVTWGWRKRISDGKVAVAYSQFLGYEKGPKTEDGKEGRMQIVEEEAKIVREIYALFLDGQTPSGIAAILTKRGIPTPAGKVKWTNSTVKSILTNEKYKGHALLQKTFTPDFLTKKAQVNRGEVPQFYVENSHPAIITPEVFDLVQFEMVRRSKRGRHTSAASVFSGKIVCGECGAYYGSKVWHSNDPYRCVIWRCNRKYDKRDGNDGLDDKEGTADENALYNRKEQRCHTSQSPQSHVRDMEENVLFDKKEQYCHTPHLREEEIKAAFCIALNQMLERRQEIIASYEHIIAELTNTDRLDREAERIQAEIDSYNAELDRMVRRNAECAQNQDAYNKAFDEVASKIDAMKVRLNKINEQLAEKAGRKRKLEAFMDKLKEIDGVTDFDEHLFSGTVEKVVVWRGKQKGEKELVFCFKDGTEIMV